MNASHPGHGGPEAKGRIPVFGHGKRQGTGALQDASRRSSRVRVLLSGLVFFVAGAALSAIWFFHSASRSAPAIADADPPLSDATLSVLRHLDSPVEVRFYSMLDASSVEDSVKAYAGRVDRLLAQYEQAAGGRVAIIRYDSQSTSNANAAAADGIQAFNIDKGESCFLGVAVACDGHKESLSRLAPEWELALEPDLTRAIARAAEAKADAQPAARADTATLDAVRRTIPNVDAISVEDGTKILRDAALAQFTRAAREMQARIKEAQQQGDPSGAAAGKLQKIQTEGADKLRQIAIDFHVQTAALQQLKKASP